MPDETKFWAKQRGIVKSRSTRRLSAKFGFVALGKTEKTEMQLNRIPRLLGKYNAGLKSCSDQPRFAALAPPPDAIQAQYPETTTSSANSDARTD